jgi:hypothetical protein
VPLKQDNPAARLHRILSSLSAHSPGTRLLDAWRAILAPTIPANDNNFGLFRRYGQFLALPKRVRDTLLTVPNINKDLYFRWVPKLEAALCSVTFSGQVAAFPAAFDKSALDNLEVCADRLSVQQPEKTVDAAELTKLTRDARQLHSDTEASAIEEDLKTYILEGLDDILSAIEDYDLEGIASLERGVKHAFGTIVVTQEKAERAVKTAIGSRFAQVLYSFYLLVNIANGTFQLSHNVHQLLLPHFHAETVQRAPASNGNAQQLEEAPDPTTKNV